MSGTDQTPDGVDECGRCGSSVLWEDCATCAATGDLTLAGYGRPSCDVCQGTGRMATCLSSIEWCEAHPLPGREDVPRHAVADR